MFSMRREMSVVEITLVRMVGTPLSEGCDSVNRRVETQWKEILTGQT